MAGHSPAFIMRLRRFLICLLLAGTAAGMMSSCASEDELKDRLDKRNDSYEKSNNKAKMRRDAP